MKLYTKNLLSAALNICSSVQPLGGSGLHLTFEHRSRALLCLTHLADPATLEALSNQPSGKIK